MIVPHALWLLLALEIGCGSPAPTAAPEAPSCAGMAPDACQGGSCCASLAVPTQSFVLGGTWEVPTSEATVSGFSLDEHEVTVGRFRAFVNAYDSWRAEGEPVPGAGAHPLIAESGWQEEWPLPATVSELLFGVECISEFQTWNAGRDELPLTCVSWYEAFAFCIWDGRRLPTEAEWEAAASGGSEGRPFPWGDSEPDATRAVYDCQSDGSAPGECAFSDLLNVGSRPDGAGKWGHQDLAGSVWEWVFDWYASYPPTVTDWANLRPNAYRSIRGSGWLSNAQDLRAPIRYNSVPSTRRAEFGFRCAGGE